MKFFFGHHFLLSAFDPLAPLFLAKTILYTDGLFILNSIYQHISIKQSFYNFRMNHSKLSQTIWWTRKLSIIIYSPILAYSQMLVVDTCQLSFLLPLKKQFYFRFECSRSKYYSCYLHPQVHMSLLQLLLRLLKKFCKQQNICCLRNVSSCQILPDSLYYCIARNNYRIS